MQKPLKINIREFCPDTNGQYGAEKDTGKVVSSPLGGMVQEKTNYRKNCTNTIGAVGADTACTTCTIPPTPFLYRTLYNFSENGNSKKENPNLVPNRKLETVLYRKGYGRYGALWCREKWELWQNVKMVLNNFPHWAKRKCQRTLIPLFRKWLWKNTPDYPVKIFNLVGKWKTTRWYLLPAELPREIWEEPEEWLDRCYRESGYLRSVDIDRI